MLSPCSRRQCNSKVTPRLKGLIDQEFGPTRYTIVLPWASCLGIQRSAAMVLFHGFSVRNPPLKNTKLGKSKETKVEQTSRESRAENEDIRNAGAELGVISICYRDFSDMCQIFLYDIT